MVTRVGSLAIVEKPCVSAHQVACGQLAFPVRWRQYVILQNCCESGQWFAVYVTHCHVHVSGETA